MEEKEFKLLQLLIVGLGVVVVLVILGTTAIYNYKVVKMAELGFEETTTIGSNSLVYQKVKR